MTDDNVTARCPNCKAVLDMKEDFVNQLSSTRCTVVKCNVCGRVAATFENETPYNVVTKVIRTVEQKLHTGEWVTRLNKGTDIKPS
jgi:uncharacterized Zn finger protein